MKTLLIHTPKFNNYYKPKGDFTDINQIPMGLFALCDFISKNNFEIEIIHLGIEYYLNNKYKLFNTFDTENIDIVGITLHWNHQSYDAIEIAKCIKEKRPNTFVFLGGFTASFFAEQIMNDFREIDAVIMGDAEIPLLHLLNSIKSNNSLDNVENLCWRDGDTIYNNGITYTANSEILNNLNYAKFDSLRNYQHFIKSSSIPFSQKKGASIEVNFSRLTIGGPIYNLPLGRGCDFNCSWCGGSSISLRKNHCKREKFTYLDQERVIKTIKDAIDAGFKTIMSSFDPYPGNEDYFIELWERMRFDKIQTSWIFEANSVPSEKLVLEFKKSFSDKESFITLSPVHGNESIRKRHKGPFFSNDQFFNIMDLMDGSSIGSEIFYIIGLPGENEKIVHDTIQLIEKIRKKYKYVRGQRVFNVGLDPGSPMQLYPKQYGIVTHLNTFKDYYHFHSLSSDINSLDTLGYYIDNYFSEKLDHSNPYLDFAKKIMEINCQYLCSLHIDPKKYSDPESGRKLCDKVSKLTGTKRDLTRPF